MKLASTPTSWPAQDEPEHMLLCTTRGRGKKSRPDEHIVGCVWCVGVTPEACIGLYTCGV